MLKLKSNGIDLMFMAALASILFSVGCSVEYREDDLSDDDQISPGKDEGRMIAGAIKVLEAAKVCTIGQDCVPLDEDCCDTGKFFVVNKESALQAKSVIRSQCNRELDKLSQADNNKPKHLDELCRDKTSVPLPHVDCVNARCVIKTAEGAPAPTPGQAVATPGPTEDQKRAKCEKDKHYECEVVYKDICNTRDEPVAINRMFSGAVRNDVNKARRVKLKQDPNFCAGKAPPKGHKKPEAACGEDLLCKIK